MDPLPLVTCVCPTRNRRGLLPLALECFAAQTYPNRELLVLDDQDAECVADLCLEHVGVIYRSDPRVVFGAKRNRAIQVAEGDIIANWDDDDWSAPGRLADQVARLRSGGCPVTGYSQMRFTDGQRWWQYDNPGYPLNTSLVFWRQWGVEHPYPAQAVASDVPLIQAALVAGVVSVVPAGEMMWASVHAGNTSRRRLGEGCFRPLPAGGGFGNAARLACA